MPSATGVIGGALVALALGLPSAAFADWAYTHWGMTPEQVVAASTGRVKVLPAAQRFRDEADHWEIGAQGTYTDGALSFPVGFTFDTRQGGLKCVMYNATDDAVEALQAALVRRYGKPLKESNYGPTKTLTWRTPDEIEFVAGASPVAAVVTHCLPLAH